jgi:hypothetical protein
VYSKGDVDAALGGIRTGTAHAPQSIIKAALGPRPDGWTAADCDAPVLSMVGPTIVPHTGYVGPSGTASASGEESTYYAWKAFNGITTSDGLSCWFPAANTGTSAGSPAWLKYAFSVPRLLGDTVYLTARDHTDVWNPKDFEIRGVRLDDSEDVLASFTNEPLATRGQKLTYSIAPATVPYKAAYVYITGSNGATFVAIDELEFTFADAPAGHLCVLSGLQVAYADGGNVYPSEVLAAPQSVDLSLAADGTHYVYADIAEDGTFSGFGHTPNKPMVGTERSGAGDLYNPVTVTMYDKDDNPIRRVYLGTAVKSAGVITSVQGFALGDRVRLPATGTILDNPFGGWHVQATQGTALLSATPAAISGVTVSSTPVVVRR